MLWCVYIQMILTPDTEDKNIYYCPGMKVDVGVRRAGKSLYIDIFFSGLFPFHMAIVVKGLGDCGQLPVITLRWWGRGGMKEFAFIYHALEESPRYWLLASAFRSDSDAHEIPEELWGGGSLQRAWLLLWAWVQEGSRRREQQAGRWAWGDASGVPPWHQVDASGVPPRHQPGGRQRCASRAPAPGGR